jgi:hypothetical protein
VNDGMARITLNQPASETGHFCPKLLELECTRVAGTMMGKRGEILKYLCMAIKVDVPTRITKESVEFAKHRIFSFIAPRELPICR